MKTAKFGGSSLADAAQFRRVRSIVERDPSRSVIVVSAPGKRFKEDHKITDLLYLCSAHLQYGVACDPVFGMVTERYCAIRDELGLSVDLESEFKQLRKKMDDGISQAELVSRGEYFSARLMADYLGYEFVDAADWLRFTLDGAVDRDASYEALARLATGRRVVIPGFYGVMPDGRIRLMQRGGSDITGALAAAALDAEAYENWTDVSGILMADPRIVEEARSISYITYSELRELSYIGAQVLHESSVFPVREKNIPLNIRNTNDPEDPGTVIRESFENEEDKANRITGIAGRTGFSVVTVAKSGMSGTSDAFRRVLGYFSKYNVPVAYTTGGIDCYSCVVESKVLDPYKYAILAELQREMEPDKIHVSEHLAVLAVVGRRMAFRSGSSARIFGALAERNVNIRMISQGPEDLNIIIGVEEKDYREAVRALYSCCQ